MNLKAPAMILFGLFIIVAYTMHEKPCFRGGCNGEICTDRDDIMTPCVYNECRQTCYNNYTECKRLDGACGFQELDGFDECMANCNE